MFRLKNIFGKKEDRTESSGEQQKAAAMPARESSEPWKLVAAYCENGHASVIYTLVRDNPQGTPSLRRFRGISGEGAKIEEECNLGELAPGRVELKV